MMTPEDARTLYAYDAWANRRVLDACAALAPEQFTKDLGSSFRSVRDTMAHIMGAEWLWLERFQGRTARLPSGDQFPDLASLRKRWAEVERDLLAYVGALSAADLERSFDYRDMKGNPHTSVMWQTLQHVANHSTYHRGQVTTLLSQEGVDVGATDLLVLVPDQAQP